MNPTGSPHPFTLAQYLTRLTEWADEFTIHSRYTFLSHLYHSGRSVEYAAKWLEQYGTMRELARRVYEAEFRGLNQ